MKPLRLGVLGSGKGSNFVALAEAIRAEEIPAEIVLVASDLAEAKILAHARERKLPVYPCRRSAFQTKLEPEIEEELAGALAKAGVELVVLQDGWYHSADYGRLDGDGFLFIEGRRARSSKIGGEMVPHGVVEEELAKWCRKLGLRHDRGVAGGFGERAGGRAAGVGGQAGGRDGSENGG